MTPKAADSRENLEDLFAFESVLAEVSSRFVNLEPAEQIENFKKAFSVSGSQKLHGQVLG